MAESLRPTISATIVTYNNDVHMLKEAMHSFLNAALNLRLYIVDNSPTTALKALCDDVRVEYIYTGANLGFGRAHNIILKNKDKLGQYHLILNPDVVIPAGTLEKIVAYMSSNSSVDVLMPQIKYPDGGIQYLPKLLPSPFNLAIRFIPFSKILFAGLDDRYVLRSVDPTLSFEPAIVSGCFMFGKSTCFTDMMFDERFFMYFEDFDLSRRMGIKYNLLYYSEVSVFHHYDSGAHKSFFLFKTLLVSMIKYFNKYGWFLDKYRVKKNNEIVKHCR